MLADNYEPRIEEADVICEPGGEGYGNVRHDVIGYWSELKLEIIRKYASAYSRILSSQSNPSFDHIYIDAFAGSGTHISKRTGEPIPGSPAIALAIEPPFTEHHFIDLNEGKVEHLHGLAEGRSNVFLYNENCNTCLLNKVFPRVQYRQYKRALCLLDPYGLHLEWEVMKTAGEMKTIEFFLNFPIMDINMNVLKHDTSKAHADQIARMNAFWGDDSWKKQAYDEDLLGDALKLPNDAIVQAFRKRLRKNAGFEYVPDPIPMRNSSNAVVYYLFFAAHRPVAANIVTDIFNRYRERTGA